MRARLIRRTLWVLGFGCLWLPVLEDPPLRSGAFVQDVKTDGVTVAMVTASPCRLHCTVRAAGGEVVAEVDDQRPGRRHALVIRGLSPDASYRYEVAREGRVVDGGSFDTAPDSDDAPVHFVALGDSGGQPWWVWLQTAPILHLPARWDWLPPRGTVSAVGAGIAAASPDFVLHLGDVIYPRGQQRHYRPGLFRPFAEMLRNAPFYAVLGNHDTMDAGGLQMLSNLELPTNDLTGDERCFSFAYGPVRVIALDLNDMVFGAIGPDHPCLIYLRAELERCAEPWVVVASHFPILSQSRQRNRADLMLNLLPLLDEFAVSLYLSGHDHCYQRFSATRQGRRTTPLVVTGGGGKSLYRVRPKEGVVVESAYHWCEIAVHRGRLELRAVGTDGAELDRLDLDLFDDPRLEGLARTNPARAARIRALRP